MTNLISFVTKIPMVLPKQIADLLLNIGASNTFLTVGNRGLRNTMRSIDYPEDFGYLVE